MDKQALTQFVSERWDSEIIGQLVEYIKIPNKSPMFDADWQANGFMEQATKLLADWAKQQTIAGMTVEIVRLHNRTPVIFIDIPGQGEDCVLMYGHLDKQPEMTGWDADLGPWLPVIKGDKLYGRGGADDGYALFGSLTAIAALQAQNISHARTVILIEACEESGSYDLPFYVDHLAERIGRPSLVVCLDSGCANYDQLWCTTSLRGLAGGNLRVDVLSEGVHSGDASGIVPSSFRVLRQLLNRIEDVDSGNIHCKELHVDIPAQRLEQAKRAADVLGEEVFDKFPFLPGMSPMNGDLGELILNRTWRPMLSITGVDGLPTLGNAGNVLRPFTAVKISLRIPPMLDPDVAGQFLKQILERDPPYGCLLYTSPSPRDH
jgi:acetylornithine deacetylase/succinyl-diaminopimelate desuccinylase-like protein